MFFKSKTGLAMLLTLLFSLSSFAAETQRVSFTGQTNEEVILNAVKEITLYRSEQRDSTCTRQEPYTVNECGYETRYRRQCTDEPGRQHCWNDTDRQCRYETRYRNQCRTAPGRRVCVTKPGASRCRMVDGRRVCTSSPPRQICRNEPGRQVCNREPYQDYVCRNVTRRRCEWRPGRNVCRDVPYQDYVCRDVVKYRSVPYACQVTVKVPYKVEKKVSHKINLTFKGELDLANAELTFGLTDSVEFRFTGTNLNKEKTYLTYEKTATAQTDDYNKISALEITVLDREEALAPVRAKSQNLWMNKGGKFSIEMDEFSLEGVDAEILVLRSSGNRHFHRRIALKEFEVESLGNGKMKISTDLGKFGFKRIKTLLGTGAKLNVQMTIHSNIKPGRTIDSHSDRMIKDHRYDITVYKNK